MGRETEVALSLVLCDEIENVATRGKRTLSQSVE